MATYQSTNTGLQIDTAVDNINQDVKTTASPTFVTLNLSTLATYADDAAAGVGGLTVGQLYKTATGELRVKL